MWQKIALILMGVGVLVLIGWAVKGFFLSSEIPLLIRVAVGAIGAGLLILLVIVIRDRIVKARTDEFKEVEK